MAAFWTVCLTDDSDFEGAKDATVRRTMKLMESFFFQVELMTNPSILSGKVCYAHSDPHMMSFDGRFVLLAINYNFNF